MEPLHRSPVENLNHVDEIDLAISDIEEALVLVPAELHAPVQRPA
jgi:NifB/MoaA-like Fe-S oxidoreductase